MFLEESQQLVSLLNTPAVIWGVFLVILFGWGAISAASFYHWDRYRVKKQRKQFGFIVAYWVVSGILIITAVVSIIIHLYI